MPKVTKAAAVAVLDRVRDERGRLLEAAVDSIIESIREGRPPLAEDHRIFHALSWSERDVAREFERVRLALELAPAARLGEDVDAIRRNVEAAEASALSTVQGLAEKISALERKRDSALAGARGERDKLDAVLRARGVLRRVAPETIMAEVELRRRDATAPVARELHLVRERVKMIGQLLALPDGEAGRDRRAMHGSAMVLDDPVKHERLRPRRVDSSGHVRAEGSFEDVDPAAWSTYLQELHEELPLLEARAGVLEGELARASASAEAPLDYWINKLRPAGSAPAPAA